MRSRRVRWAGLFLIPVLMAIVALAIWVEVTSIEHVHDRTERFAGFMRIVRPIILVIILASWRPVFAWAHECGLVSDIVHHRAQILWPRVSIWVLLIEVSIGQGYLLLGLTATALYWFFARIGKGDVSDGRR